MFNSTTALLLRLCLGVVVCSVDDFLLSFFLYFSSLFFSWSKGCHFRLLVGQEREISVKVGRRSGMKL